MNRFRVTMVALAFGMLAGTARPADPTKEDIEKATMRAEAVAELAFAAELAALGRGDTATGVKSPESLVIAGGMLRRANGAFGGKMEPLGVTPTDKDGKPVKGEAVKTPELAAQVEALFDEARTLVAGDKARAAAIEALIKDVKGWPSRGAAGGPKVSTRVLNPGETQTFNVAFVGGQPALVAMTSTGPAKIDFSIDHVGGNNLISLKGQVANYGWVPAVDKDGVRKFVITLTNNGKRPTTYTLTTN